MKTPPSKAKMIERHLLKGRKLTQQDAIRKFRHYRLAVAIHRLREKGANIETTMRTEKGSTFAEYRMIKLILIILFCIFTGEIVGIDPPMNGLALRPSLLLCNAPLSSEIMSRKIEYKKGEQIGNVIFIRDYPCIAKRRKAEFKCYCGSNFVATIADVKNGHTNSCGCYQKAKIFETNTIHGMSRHRLYGRWVSMNNRCYLKSNHDYQNYGARGITVCAEWQNDPKAYIEYILSLPNALKSGMTLDRINNDGNYEPGNLRWANGSTQLINRRISKINKSGYKGVYWDKRIRKFHATLRRNYKRKHIGYFNTAEEAAQARSEFIKQNPLWP